MVPVLWKKHYQFCHMFSLQLPCCNSAITVTTATVILPAAQRSQNAQEWSIKWGEMTYWWKTELILQNWEPLLRAVLKGLSKHLFMPTVMLAGKKVEQEWVKTCRSNWQGMCQGISHRYFAFWFCMERRFSHKIEFYVFLHRQFLQPYPHRCTLLKYL